MCWDVAVLGAPEIDPGELKYRELIASLEPACIALASPTFDVPFRVHVHTHDSQWLSGTCEVWFPTQILLEVRLDHPAARIAPGTSGAPVFDYLGRVVAIAIH